MSFRIDQLAVLNLATVGNSITAGSFVKSGGTSSQFLKADGSVDSSAYITGITSGMVTTALGYTPVPNTRNITINGVTQDLSVDRTWTISAGVSSVSGSGAGISVSPTTGAVVVSNTGVTSNVAGTGISVSGATGAVTITNTGVTSIVAGTAITISGATGAVTINNAGVTSVNGNTGAITGIITTSNYNSYSPTLTGGGASGTWGINITGTAGSETLATVTGRGASTSTALTLNGTVTFTSAYSGGSGDWTNITNPSYKVSPVSGYWRIVHTSSNSTVSGVYNYETGKDVYWGEPSDSGSYYFRGRTLRFENNSGTYVVLHSGNYNSYAPTLTGGGASGTWSINITGNADTVDNFHASQSTVANNIVVRDANGYIFGNYINMTDDGNPGGGTAISSFITKQGDNYYRSVSPTNAMVSIRGVASGSWGINITGSAGSASTATYATNTSKLYSTDAGYCYGCANPYYGYLTYDGSRWLFQVSPGTPAAVRVAYSDLSGQVSINYNNDSNSTYQMLWGSGNSVYGTAGVYVNPSSDYVYANSFNAGDWFRSSGNSGWYNSTYAVGIYATDSTWVRTYNNAQFYSSTIIEAGGSVRAPIFYDSDNTAYYANFADTGTSINIAGSINAATYNKPGLLLNASGSTSSGAAFGMQQITSEGWSGIFVDYEPYTGWGLYHDNPANYFLITSESSTGSFGGGFTVPSRVSGNRTAYVKHRLDQNNGDFIAGGNIYMTGGTLVATQSWVNSQGFITGGSFLPYGNWSGNTGMNDYRLYLRTSGDTNHYLWNAADDWEELGAYAGTGFRVTSNNGANGLLYVYGSSNGGYTYSPYSFRAPMFYDSDNTSYYCDPASTSVLNTISSYTIYNTSLGSGYYFTAGDWGWRHQTPSGWIQFGPANTGHAHIYTDRSNFYFNVNDLYLNGYIVPMYGYNRTGDLYASRYYDANDTSYYLDPASTSNLNKFSEFTMSYNDMNPMSANSPYAARYAGSALYRNGTMGYGTTDFNVMFSNWGSGFIDSWSSPANAPGGSSHYVGLQGFHYNHVNNSQAYGFQMACAGEADNRFFWRSAWPNLRSWVEMIHSGNIGSQSVSNADTVDGYHATAFPYRSGGSSGYYQVADWMQFNTTAGLYWPSYNGAHIYPNTSTSYGSIRIDGSRSGWRGINFDGAVTLMMNNNETGFYRDGYGWQWRWENGTAYVNKNGQGGGTSATVLDSSNYTSYAPSLTGSGASGTWSISITGNAATVGGVSESQIVYGGAGRASNNVGNMNDTNQKSGLYYAYDPTGRPYAEWWNWITIAGNSWQSSNNYEFQLAHCFHDDGFYVRRMTNGTVYSWRYILTDSNSPYAYNMNQYVRTSDAPTFNGVYTNDWFRANGCTGFYFQSYGHGLRAPECEGNNYGNVCTYGGGRNGWAGYGITASFTMMGRSGTDVGLHDNGSSWIFYSPYGTQRLGFGTSTTSASYRIYVSGAIYATGDVVAYSDRRKKTDIVTIDNALEKVTNLRGVFYTKIGEEKKGRKTGVIAQEINEVLPEVVTYASDTDEYGVSYGNIAGVLIEAIKEQNELIKTLKSEIDQLKAKLE